MKYIFIVKLAVISSLVNRYNREATVKLWKRKMMSLNGRCGVLGIVIWWWCAGCTQEGECL